MNDRLDWLVGGYYANEKLTRRDNTSLGADADRYFGTLVRAASPALAGFPGYNLLNPFAQGFVAQPADDQSGFSPAIPAGGLSAGHRRDRRPGREHAAGEPDHARRLPAERQQLRALHPQHLQDHRPALADARRALHDRHKKLSADLTSGSQCAAYRGNIARLQALAAAAAADPAGNGGLNPAIAALASALANQVLTPIGAAPCVLNSVNGSFSGGSEKENKFSGTAVLSYKPTDQLLTYASYLARL